MPNVNDLLTQVQNQINPGMFGQFNPAYIGQANSIYQALANRLFGSQMQEEQMGREYEGNLADMMVNEQRARTSLRDAMANRGLGGSGIYTGALARQGQDYSSGRNKLSSGYQTNLANLAGQRLGFQNEASSGLMGAQQNAVNMGMQNAYQQAQTEAQQRQAAQEASDRATAFQSQQQYQNQMLGMTQQPQADQTGMNAPTPAPTPPPITGVKQPLRPQYGKY